MVHTMKIVDADPFFEINPDSRAILKQTKNEDNIVQYDHNSERFTFSIPRIVEGHDMTECNVVEVHYLTINNDTKEQTKGAYAVKDLSIDADDAEKVVFTWLISQNVTQIAGVVNFLIRFSCVAADGTIEYAWNTGIYKGVNVSKGIYNADYIIEQYADVLEQWKQELFGLNLEGVNNIRTAEAEAIENIENAGGTLFANAVKRTANGKTVTVNDVSPVAHTVKAKISGKNLIDDVTCTIETQSKDGVTITNNGDGSYTLTGENTSGGFAMFTSAVKPVVERAILPAGTYTSHAGCTTVIKGIKTGKEANKERTFVVDEPFQIVKWYCYINVDNTVGSGAWANMPYTFYPQLEKGDTATEYEPYIDPTTVSVMWYCADETEDWQVALPKADGTVNIPSLSPTMTVLTDNDKVNIELEYNVDIKKAGLIQTVDVPAGFNKPCVLISGKFSDFFVASGEVTEAGAALYCFTENIAQYADYMYDFSPDDDNNNLCGYVYNVDLTKVCEYAVGLNTAMYQPMMNLYGYDSNDEDAYISFYLAAEDGLEITEEKKTAGYWNGNAYIGIALESDIGNINAALKEIIKLQNDLIGGDS